MSPAAEPSEGGRRLHRGDSPWSLAALRRQGQANELGPDRLVNAPITPAHLAYRVGRGRWAFPLWLQYLNQRVTSFLLSPDEGFLIVEVPIRHGKVLPLDTPLPTPDGWTTMGRVRPGDRLLDERGRPCRVTAVSDEELWEAWRLRFNDGSELLAGEPHQWVAWNAQSTANLGDLRRRRGEAHGLWPEDWAMWGRPHPVRDTRPASRYGPETLTTAQMAARVTERWRIPTSFPLDLPARPLPMDPWCLGFWLGDGNTSGARVTCGPDDLPFVRSRHLAAGYQCEALGPMTLGPGTGKGNSSTWSSALRRAGVLGDKHVPAPYMRASAAQRLSLLQGLMDSDGGCERRAGRRRVSFSNQNKALAESVFELAASLGERPSIDSRPARIGGRPTGATVHRVSWSVCREIPFMLPRKAAGVGVEGLRQLTVAHRMVNTVERTGVTVPMRCVSVDSPSHCYLAGPQMVPTHNSAFISKRVPAWFLGMFPDRYVIATSYSNKLVREMGRANRAIMADYGEELFGLELEPGSASAVDWSIRGHDGGMLAVTRGGQIIGSGGDLIVVDDPIKGHREARSPKFRDDLWDWFTDDLRGRLQPGGKMIVVMSRWHEDDLIGRLVAFSEQGGPDADPWERIHLPALAAPPPWETDEKGQLLSGQPLDQWRDVLGRAEGEPLWPEWWSRQRLQARMMAMGPVASAAQLQQRPVAIGGDMFPAPAWRYDDEAPRGILLVRRWDLADNEGEGDWAASTLMGMDAERLLYIIDVRRIRRRAYEVEQWARATVEEDTERWGRHRVHHVIEQEPGSSGLTVADKWIREIFAGESAEKKRSDSKKELALGPFSAQVQAHNVSLVRARTAEGYGAASWWAEFKEEARVFPNGPHDDMIETAGKAYTDLAERMAQRQRRRSQARSPSRRPRPGGSGMS